MARKRAHKIPVCSTIAAAATITKNSMVPLMVKALLELLRRQLFLPSLASRYAWRAESNAEPISSFFLLTTSLPRSTHWLIFSRASRPRFLTYSRPSCALLMMASRVSRPERGAYRTPRRAPKPSPARNHIKLLPLSLSDIRQPPTTPLLPPWFTRLQIEPVCGRERSGSPQAKSRSAARDLLRFKAVYG